MHTYFNFVWHNRRFLFFGFLLALLSSFGQTYFIALFGAEVRSEYELSHGDLGFIFSLATLASALCLIWAGKKLDEIDLRIYSGIIVIGLAIACGLLAGGQGMVFLFFAFFGLRLFGQGLMGHTSQTAMAKYFDEDRGKALSVANQGHAVGQAGFPMLVVLVIACCGWRGAWWWYAAVLICVMLPVVLILLRGQRERDFALKERLFVSDQDDSETSTSGRQWMLREVLHQPTFYLVMSNVIAPGMLMTGLMFHQIHMIETKGWDLTWFAACFAAYSASSVVSGIAVGPMIDRFSAHRLITLYLVPMGLGILSLAVMDHPITVLIWFVLSGITSGMHRSVTSAFWAEAYGVRHLGAIRGFVSGVSVIGTAVSPVLFGWLIDIAVSIDTIATICVVWISLSLPATWLGLRLQSK